jgi:hypothetical protein
VGLYFPPGTDPPWDRLAAQKDLEYWDLTGCHVNDKDLEYLVGLKMLRSLRVNGTAVTDACLPTLERMPAITAVGVDGTRITEDGLRRLHEVLLRRHVMHHPLQKQNKQLPPTPAA